MKKWDTFRGKEREKERKKVKAQKQASGQVGKKKKLLENERVKNIFRIKTVKLRVNWLSAWNLKTNEEKECNMLQYKKGSNTDL